MASVAQPGWAQPGIIGAVEVHGARGIAAADVRSALGLAVGDRVPDGGQAVRARLERLPGVAEASVEVVCCEQGRSIVYAGIRERAAPAPRFAPPPDGIVTLPDDVVNAEAEFTAALQEAVQRGQAEEDHSAGHALMAYGPARAVQLRFVALAQHYEEQLRAVLAMSRFPLQRALAAQVLAYLPDKRRVVDLLGPALGDPSPEVRNDAARALWIVAEYARLDAALRAGIPVDRLVTMMQSVHWTDRNKASLVLMALTSARDTAMLATLDATLRAELEEMAWWRTQHALPAFVILGRIRGLSDDEIFAAWTAGERERVLPERRAS
ncbi:MAG TPA: hypothetical protein VK922_12330 [Gemmatimonadaceae bacterium]|nr:hypothetical protein [Gemmatimonadaceae bacterium]